MSYPTKKLGEVIDFLKGKKMPVTEEQRLGYEPYIGIDTLRTREYKIFTPEKNGVRCSQDDVLVVWDGAYAGTVGIEVSGFAGSTVAKVVIREPELDSRFLRYFWELNGTKIRNAAQGAAIPHLSKPFINNLKIPLPPLKIQKQIVERLDKIAEAQKLNDDLIQKSDELFQSLFYNEYEVKHNQWELKKLQESCKKTDQMHPSKLFKKEFSYIDIASIDDDKVIRAQIISVDKAPSRARKVVKAGDTIFSTVRPYLKHIAYIPEMLDGSIASTGFCVIRPNTDLVDSLFMNYVVESDHFVRKVLPFQRGANYPAVSDKNVYDIKIPLPPLETQKQIVAKLSAVQEYKTQLLAQKSKLKELFDSVLTKSFK